MDHSIANQVAHKGEIVIVDDLPANLKLLSEILSEAGYKVRSTTDPEQCLKTVQLRQPELIILDVKMPVMNGYELCAEFKKQPLTSHIPIIFISALDNSEDRLKGFNVGGVDFISKPFQHREVLSRVNTHISLYQIQHKLTLQKSELEDRVKERTAELTGTNQKLKGAQRIARLGSWEWHIDSGEMSWSDEMYHILGLDDSIVQPSLDSFIHSVHPQDRLQFEDSFTTAKLNISGFTIEHRIILPNDQVRYLKTIGESLSGPQLSQFCILGTTQDVTEHKLIQEQLEQASSVFENTAEGIMVTDAQRRIISVNPAFTDITGYTEQDAKGQLLEFRYSQLHNKSDYHDVFISLDEAGHWRGEMNNLCKDGSINPELITITAVTDEEQNLTNYILLFSDISTLKKSEQKLEYLAHHDPLTGLANRLLLNDRLQHAISTAAREKRSLAVLFIDLDRFKDVNDSFGHTFGDKILKQVATRLKHELRANDTVARLGGDEFLVLAENMNDRREIEILSQKILSIFNEPFAPDQNEIFVGGSIGISCFPDDGDNPADLIRNADSAMYLAKGDGRFTFRFYTRELTAAATDRLQMETALRKAIDNNELSLNYQPIVDPDSGQAKHIEALLRWHNPDLGQVPPDRFIPLAEATSLILPIGEWVLKKACQDMRQLIDEGHPLKRVSVNISSLQVQRCDLPVLVGRILRETGLSPEHLDLEITETVLMDEPDKVLESLNQLKALGVTLTVDDFGTGYSSLSYLKRFPIDTLKIDQSFVRDIPHDQDDEAIAKAIIAMARSLRLGIVAEGVETQQQRSFLMQEDCERAQGYLYSRPVPFTKLLEYLTDKQTV